MSAQSSAHLGDRVSALLDGQLSEAEAMRAWAHVDACDACREHVDREQWIKHRLAGLTYAPTGASDGLKGSLRGAGMCQPGAYLAVVQRRRHAAFAAVGGTAVGAAVMGVLALGAAPASAPMPEVPAKTTHSGTPTSSPDAVVVVRAP